MGKLMFHVCGAFAEFERSMIQQRANSGIKRAGANGVKFGPPKIDPAKKKRIRDALALEGKGILKVANEYGVGSGTVQRIKAEMGGSA